MSAIASLGRHGYRVGARLLFKLFDHLRAAKRHIQNQGPMQGDETDQERENQHEEARTGPGEEHQRKRNQRRARTVHKPDTWAVTPFVLRAPAGSWVGVLSLLLGFRVGAQGSRLFRRHLRALPLSPF